MVITIDEIQIRGCGVRSRSKLGDSMAIAPKADYLKSECAAAPNFVPKDLFTTTRRMASAWLESVNMSRVVWELVRHYAVLRRPEYDLEVLRRPECDQEVLRHFVAELAKDPDSRQYLKRILQEMLKMPEIVSVRCKATFLEKANEQVGRGAVDAALDTVYDCVDDLLMSEEFEQLDQILCEVDTDKTSLHILLALLTATLPARERLSSRDVFFTRVRDSLEKRNELRPGLLDGLE